MDHAIALLDGRFVSESEARIPLYSRIVRYGDGLYETMRYTSSRIPFLPAHLARLQCGMELLGLENSLPDPDTLDERLKQLAVRNNVREGIIRLVVYRDSDGKYLPDSDHAGWFAGVEPLDFPGFPLNGKGLTLGLFARQPVMEGPLAPFKTANALPYILAARHAHKAGWDDALLLNVHGRIAEATASNVFFVREKQLITPSLEESCMAGIMRNHILLLAEEMGIPCRETSVAVTDLGKADEIFLTNAVAGIRWVARFGNKDFTHKMTRQFSRLLNKFFDNES